MKRAISGTLLAVGVLAAAGSLAALFLSATPTAHAQTAPPAPALGTLVATSACAIAVPWTEPSGGTPATTFTLQRDALQMTNLKNLGGQVYSGSGVKEYLDTRAWNLVNMGVGTTEATLNTDPGVSHQYRVRACSSAGNCSAWTPTVAKAAKLLPQPSNIGVPTNITAIGSSTDSRIIRVRFSTSTAMSASFKGFGGFVIASSGSSIFVPTSALLRPDGTFVYEEQGNPAATAPTTYHLSFYESDRYCLPPPTRSTQYATSLPTDVVIPPRPASFTATFQAAAPPLPNRIRLVWTNIPSATDGYYITRTTTDVSGNRVTYTLPHDQLLAGTTSFTDDFNIVANPPRTYTYQIRACSTSGGCSFEQTKSAHSSNSVVWDLEAWPVYASATNSVASVRLQWKTETEGGIPSVKVRWTQDGAVIEKTVNGQTSATYANIPWSATPYRFYVGQDTTGYESVFVDLNITKVFSGTIFSSMGDDTILPPHLGVGWISLNSDTPKPGGGTHGDIQSVSSPVKWAVFARADGSVGGEGFAAVQPDDLGWHGYGWVSFQKDDLRGCPSANSADCRATYDASSGVFHGWARVCDSPDDVGEVLTGCRADVVTPTMASTYSKWISLDKKQWELAGFPQTTYGLRFDMVQSMVTGTVWGGDVLGWGEASGGMSMGCTVPAPTVTNTVQATSVTLDWTVPSGTIYDQLRIIRNGTEIYDVADDSGGHLVDSGLTPDTDYTYQFVRRQGTNSCTSELQVRTLTGNLIPTLAVSPASLSFSATAGGAPLSQTITISNNGGGTMGWTVSDDRSWLSFSPTSGTNNGTVTVSVAPQLAGTYTGTITVSAPTATPNSKTVGVTLTVSPEGGIDGYTIDCTPQPTSIDLQWVGSFATSHIARLFGVEQGQPFPVNPLTTRSSQPLGSRHVATGRYLHGAPPNPLLQGTVYNYQLRVSVDGESVPRLFPATGLRSCTTAPPTASVENMNARTSGPNSLHVTWEANVPGSTHTIVLQRMRVTPQPSTNVIVTRSGTEATIVWQNQTNAATAASPTPYYHVLEQSNFTNPFGTGDGTVVSSTVEFPNDRVFREGTTQYSRTQTGLVIGTNYFYRLRACSYVRVDLVNHPPVTPETAVCTDPTPVVSTVEPPFAPTNLTASEEPTRIVLTWRDNAINENGYEVRRMVPYVAVTNLSPVDPPATTGSYRWESFPTGDPPETQYTFQVLAFRNVGNLKQYSSPATVTARRASPGNTLTVTVVGSGRVRDDLSPNRIDCGSNQTCANTYPALPVETVTLRATPAAAFTGWSGACINTAGDCVVTMDAARAVTATFSGGGFHVRQFFASMDEALGRTVQATFRSVDRLASALARAAGRIVSGVGRAIDRTWAQVGFPLPPPPPSTLSLDLNNYFTWSVDLPYPAYDGAYDDEGLDDGVVYAYRGKARLEGGTETAWSNIGTGQTLDVGNCPVRQPYTVRMCIRNSTCAPQQTEICLGGDPLPDECGTNYDCREVGTSRKSFEETKP
ncbi:MAG: BACON domain-containing protein [bacterium]|nr:BACON domain-containing protein [bacterium]